ncbi:DNA cytosine methyltransferase, partial [Pseudomonas aeruginosa]|nr:DNA cytosine methyltransferase [Pseudomonas aeruginosa]
MADQPYLVPMDAQHLAAANLTEFANASNQRTFSVAEPLRTQVAQVKGGHFALSAATLVEIGYGERAGQA